MFDNLLLFLLLSVLVPFCGRVGPSGAGPPFFAVESLIRMESCGSEGSM